MEGQLKPKDPNTEAVKEQLKPILDELGYVSKDELKQIDEDKFDEMFDVHVKGAFFVTKAVIAGMKEKRYGKIINISSIYAMGGCPWMSHYAAAKSALSGLTHSWAREFAPFNIMVNAVAPGFVETPATRAAVAPDEMKEIANRIPLGRLGDPRDMAYAVAWLASPEADFITGQVISLNGGQTIVGI